MKFMKVGASIAQAGFRIPRIRRPFWPNIITKYGREYKDQILALSRVEYKKPLGEA